MRLLLKKHANNMELFHGTSLDAFINICNDGNILPYSHHGTGGVGSGTGETGGGSLEQDAVYLTDNEEHAYMYGEYLTQGNESDVAAYGAILKVNVDTTNLGPDLDEPDALEDHGYDEDEDEDSNIDSLTYEDTLAMYEQCVYFGTIPTNQITSVKFIEEFQPDGKSYKDYFKIGQWLSFEEASQLAGNFNPSV